jgi:hypothetical protein
MKERLAYSTAGDMDLDFSEFIYGDSFAQSQKDKQRELIAQHTAEFLARGGEIEVLPYDPTAEREGRVGYWNQLGSESMSQEDSSDEEEFFTPYG